MKLYSALDVSRCWKQACGCSPTVLVAAPLERSSTSRSEPFVR